MSSKTKTYSLKSSIQVLEWIELDLNLSKAELLINQENYEEALKNLPIVEPLDEKTQSEVLKCISICYYNLGELGKAKETSLQLLDQSKKSQEVMFGLDAICILLRISLMVETRKETKRLINEGEAFFNQILDEESKDYKSKKAALLYLKAISYDPNINLDKQLPLIQESLSVREEINDKMGISESLFGLGYYYYYKGDHNSALNFFKESLNYGERIANKYLISQAYRAIGNIYLLKGEFNQALVYTEQALALSESIKNKCDIAHNLLHLGEIYYFQGELELAESFIVKSLTLSKAIEYTVNIILGYYDLGRLLQDRGEFQPSLQSYKKALKIAKEKEATFYLAEGLYNLIRLYTYHLSPIEAIPLIKELEKLKEEVNNIWHNLIYRTSRALLLKTSERLADKMEALCLFQKIVNEPQIAYNITVEAIINLSELLIYELKITGNESILNELDHYCSRLLKIASDQNSHSLLAQSYWLQSKLALLKFDIQQAQKLLFKAQAITEEKGLKTLADSISFEHYSFFSQLKKWEEYIDKNVSLSRRIELAQLENLVVKMIYQRLSDIPTKSIDELMKIDEFRIYLKEAKKILSEYEEG
ncbi:MAG: tetratricopeptide repeat protein [Promethearchaeota archaeon]